MGGKPEHFEGEVEEIQPRQHRPEEEKILNQNTDAVVSDPLYLIPDTSQGKEPTVSAPVLPDLSLPEPYFNVLEEILQQEGSDPFSVEIREEEKMELMKDTLNVLKELLHSMQQNGQLLTKLNTGLG